MEEAQTDPMARERDERGRIKETYPLEDVRAALAEIGPATTHEVEQRLGSSYETAYHKLRALEDDGRVTSRKVGNARLWTATDSSGEGEADDDENERVFTTGGTGT